MPISDDEFEAGTVDAGGDDPVANDEAGPLETEKDLVTSFLSERPDRAFTAREIVLGVDFSPVFMNRTRNPFGSLVDGVIDVAGDATASAIVVDDVEEALEELVDEGVVAAKEVETDDGTTTYYRIG